MCSTRSTRCGVPARITDRAIASISSVGADQFLEIPTWKDYETLLGLCDFIVASRPGFPAGRAASRDPAGDCWPSRQRGRTTRSHALDCAAANRPYICSTPWPATSPTEVRRAAGPGKNDSRACAAARGGIHYKAGPIPVKANPSPRTPLRPSRPRRTSKQRKSRCSIFGPGRVYRYFLLCTGFSTPQVQAIGDEIEERLGRWAGVAHREGRGGAEWVLLDYGGFIVHIFTRARAAILRSRAALARAPSAVDFTRRRFEPRRRREAMAGLA